MKTGHIKDQLSDDLGNRKFIINCLGGNDQREYYSIAPFGLDFNAPVNTRALTTKSANKDIVFSLGVLNKIKIDDLVTGESAIFSTDEAGENIVSKIVLRNTGAIEIEANAETTLTVTGNVNIVVDGDSTIQATGDVNINADGNAVVTATQLNVNSGNLTVD